MQGATRVGGKANDVARIGRDFRFYQDDVKHGVGVSGRFGAGDHQGADLRGAGGAQCRGGGMQ